MLIFFRLSYFVFCIHVFIFMFLLRVKVAVGRPSTHKPSRGAGPPFLPITILALFPFTAVMYALLWMTKLTARLVCSLAKQTTAVKEAQIGESNLIKNSMLNTYYIFINHSMI